MGVAVLKQPTEVRAAILNVAVGLGIFWAIGSAATFERKRKHDAATAAMCDIERMMEDV
jgi:hypothetical protein